MPFMLHCTIHVKVILRRTISGCGQMVAFDAEAKTKNMVTAA